MELYFQQYRMDRVLAYFNRRLGDSLKTLVEGAEREDLPLDVVEALINKLIGAFEGSRQLQISLPAKNESDLLAFLNESVQKLSEVDPIRTFELVRLVNEFALFREIAFPAERLRKVEYLKTWSAMLSTYRADIRSLKRLILRTSLGLGPIQWTQMWWALRKAERSLSGVPDEEFEDLLRSVKPAANS